MKKFLFALMLLGAISAFAGQYPDGMYRGV